MVCPQELRPQSLRHFGPKMCGLTFRNLSGSDYFLLYGYQFYQALPRRAGPQGDFIYPAAAHAP